MKFEKWLFFWGTIALFGGNAGMFVIPLYIGWVIDDMGNENFTRINRYCFELMIVIFVSEKFSQNFILKICIY